MPKYETKYCLICREKERLKTLYPKNFDERNLTPEVFSARRSTDHVHYEIVRCENCSLVFSRNVLCAEDLSLLYSRSKITYGEYTNIICRDYWRHLSPFIHRIPREAVLEIGCGSGFFLEKLIAEGFKQICGCEPSVEAGRKADPKIQPNIFLGLFRKGIYPSNSFDLVCSFQTLDHVSDPNDVLQNCFEVLKPSGIAYFITHDAESLQARLLGERSPIIDIEHIYLFNKKTLRKVFEANSFAVQAIFDVQNSYPLQYWVQMFPMPSAVRKFFLSLLRVICLANLRLPLAVGNIGIIAKCLK